jgi:Reverse transcriptase (RNA-dependent DNA polymerase)
MTQQAIDTNILSAAGEARLRGMMDTYRDIWAIKVSGHEVADVAPLQIQLTDNANPRKLPTRVYSPPQKEFMKAKLDELVRLGLIYRNSNSRWASPSLILLKPGPEKFRFTADLRVPNAYTSMVSWPMPHLPDVINNFQGRQFFGSFDFLHGYWQLPLAENSQECQSIETPFGVFTQTRVLHGTTNATAHMQACIEQLLKNIRDNVAIWLDDVAPHGATETEYLDALEEFFRRVQQARLKLYANKVTLISDTVTICGRIISRDGVKYSPKSFQALLDMPEPANASELHQYLGRNQLDALTHSFLRGKSGTTSSPVEGSHCRGQFVQNIDSQRIPAVAWGTPAGV